MVLGQSMESSAGDPTRAGTIKNEFFYDPFIAGNRCDHANLFYDILQSNGRIHCYLLNTGSVGEGRSFKDITLGDTMGILDSLLRGGKAAGAKTLICSAVGISVGKVDLRSSVFDGNATG